MDSPTQQHKIVRIDLTPLVDVVFLLLIFFMVSTTFREDQGIELRLPEASAAEARETDDDLRVQLAADGSIHFAEQALDLKGLEAAIREALKGSRDQLVVLEADSKAEHGSVVSVMDALRRAGARGLSVATTPLSE
jgi:biopolymer transport protein ExbD